MTATYIGLVDGLHTWEVRDDDGNVVGKNQSPHPPGESPVPASVSARQIRLWLVRHGVTMAQVDAAINALDDQQQREECRVEWEFAPYIERTHPLLVPIAIMLGLSESQVDDAFREAATI